MLNLMLFFVLTLLMIPVISADCVAKDLKVAYVNEKGEKSECVIKAADLIKDGSIVSTRCNGITCSCNNGARTCCHLTQCVQLEDYCVNVDAFLNKQIYCSTEKDLQMDEEVPVREDHRTPRKL